MGNIFSTLPEEILAKEIRRGDFPFSQKLFWDTPLQNIDPENHKDFIIERIIGRGGLYDFYFLLKLYSTEEIVSAVKKVRTFDKKLIHFCSLYFDIPKTELHASSYYD